MGDRPFELAGACFKFSRSRPYLQDTNEIGAGGEAGNFWFASITIVTI
jgi:hypothetical protein